MKYSMTTSTTTAEMKQNSKTDSSTSFAPVVQSLITSLRLGGLYVWRQQPGSKLSTLGAVCSAFWIALISVGLAVICDAYRKGTRSSNLPEENIKLAFVATMVLSFESFAVAIIFTFNATSGQLKSVLSEIKLFFDANPMSATVKKRLYYQTVVCLMGVVFVSAIWFYCRLHGSIMFPTEAEAFGFRVPTLAAIVVLHGFPILAGIMVAVTLTNFYAFVAFALGCAFRKVTEDVVQEYNRLERSETTLEKYKMSLEFLRMRHLQLSNIVLQFDSLVAPGIFLLICSCAVDAVLMVGMVMEDRLRIPLSFFFTSSSEDIISAVISAIGCGYLIFSCLVAASFLKTQAHSIARVLNVVLEKFHHDGLIRSQIIATLQRLNNEPIVLTGWNLVNLDTNFIVTTVGMLTTYVLVMHEIASRKDEPCNGQMFNATTFSYGAE